MGGSSFQREGAPSPPRFGEPSRASNRSRFTKRPLRLSDWSPPGSPKPSFAMSAPNGPEMATTSASTPGLKRKAVTSAQSQVPPTKRSRAERAPCPPFDRELPSAGHQNRPLSPITLTPTTSRSTSHVANGSSNPIASTSALTRSLKRNAETQPPAPAPKAPVKKRNRGKGI